MPVLESSGAPSNAGCELTTSSGMERKIAEKQMFAQASGARAFGGVQVPETSFLE